MASAILYNNRNNQNPNFTPNITQNNFNFSNFNNISRQPHYFPVPENPKTHIYRHTHQNPAPEKPFFRQATMPNGYRYITFRLGSFSKLEVKNLKKRLMSDLNRVRTLQKRIENDLTVLKRPSPLPLVKETRKKQKISNAVKKSSSKKGRKKDDVMKKKCKQILGKLMKQKKGWVFNKPVDIIGMKLHDYKDIIKNPMDLGTIKKKMEKNVYKDDYLEFAKDVRLTFENAMVYNSKGSEVYCMAEKLLSLFESSFNGNVNDNGNDNVKVEKKEMTGFEKEELAECLLSMDLKKEETDELVRILKGRDDSGGLRRLGDEIEIDIGVIDDETLWELRRFIDEKRKMDCEGKGGVMEEEDVDIGEEMELTNFESVEIEKDSGSDSDSSSSSDCSAESGSYNEHEAN